MTVAAQLLGPGPHLAFVAAAYGISALVLAGLTVDSLLRARRWRRRAQALREPGARR